jgi:hypothetical protein
MADLRDGFASPPKPRRNLGSETNRNQRETSMKPAETRGGGFRRNSETAPLKGAVAGFATRAGRGSMAGHWASRSDARPNLTGALTLETALPAGARLWLSGWTQVHPVAGEFVSLVVEVANGGPRKRGRSREPSDEPVGKFRDASECPKTHRSSKRVFF